MTITDLNNETTFSDALFRLKLVPPTGLKFDKLTVKFEEPGFDVFCCDIACKSYVGKLSTEDISTDVETQKLAPLFRSWISDNQTVELQGTSSEQYFYVRSAYTSKLSAATTALLVQRLLEADANAASSVDNLDGEKLIRTEAEVRAFYQICGHTLPPNLRRWMRDELNYIQTASSVIQKQQAICITSKVASIDWRTKILKVPSPAEVQAILDEELFGMEDVKMQILELVAYIRHSGGKIPPKGLILVGVPGAGKTHILRLLARILGMPFAELDFSTTEADSIKGSVRIYENARESSLFRAYYSARSSTVMLYIEEIDKAILTAREGNPTEVLLSIFSHDGLFDNMLETKIPCTNVLSVCTANDASVLSPQLRRRLNEISVPGYSPDEKRVIFDSFLFPRQLSTANIAPSELCLGDRAKELLISSYAIEAGAGDLETYAQRLASNYALSVEDGIPHHEYTQEDIVRLFGPSKKPREQYPRIPGIARSVFILNGAVHSVVMEASVRDGEGQLSTAGIFSGYQREYLRAAYEAFRGTSIDISNQNVTLFSRNVVVDASKNYLSVAAICAIWSALTGVLIDNEIAFFGGVDILGNLYHDCTESITPLLNTLAYRGVKTLYAPPGIGGLIHGRISERCNIALAETPDIETLFSLIT